jgi:alpha-glucan,water dikinase
MEDIPSGVVAILTRSSTDILSHIAIRARNQGVLLATCHDDAKFNELKALSGDVTVAANPAGDVVVSAGAVKSDVKTQKKSEKVALKTFAPSDKLVVADSEFSALCVGGKSNNLQKVCVYDCVRIIYMCVCVCVCVCVYIYIYVCVCVCVYGVLAFVSRASCINAEFRVYLWVWL